MNNQSNNNQQYPDNQEYYNPQQFQNQQMYQHQYQNQQGYQQQYNQQMYQQQYPYQQGYQQMYPNQMNGGKSPNGQWINGQWVPNGMPVYQQPQKSHGCLIAFLIVFLVGIPILAILAAAMAPALIRYIDKSRKSDDVAYASTLYSAASSCLADENIYSEIVSAGGVKFTVDSSGINGIDGNLKTTFSSKIGYSYLDPNFKKKGASCFVVEIDSDGSITVSAGRSTGYPICELQPTTDPEYR